MKGSNWGAMHRKDDSLYSLLDGLSHGELGKLRKIIDELLKLPQGGHVVQRYVKQRGKEYGPYLYLRWREDGKYKSKYIGKAA